MNVTDQNIILQTQRKERFGHPGTFVHYRTVRFIILSEFKEAIPHHSISAWRRLRSRSDGSRSSKIMLRLRRAATQQ